MKALSCIAPLLVVAALDATPCSAQTPAPAAAPAMTVRSGPRANLPRAEEIALARSGGPLALSDSATIYVFASGKYEVAAKGTSGATCYVSRGWVDAVEPHCFDREGAETVMPMEMHRVELLHRGLTMADADTSIANGLLAGRFRLPRRPATTYMMSAEQRLVAPSGRIAGAYRPFVLIYWPYITDADLGFVGARRSFEPGISEPGGPLARLTVFVSAAVAVRR